MLHFTLLSSSVLSVTANLPLPIVTDSISPNLPWQTHILQQQALFSANNELDGNVFTKNWDIVASPYGQLIATCISLHPSNQVQYTMAPDQFCQVAITAARGNDDEFYLARNCHLQGKPHTLGREIKYSRAEDLSAEAILFSIKSWIHNSDLNAEGIHARLETSIGSALTGIGFIRKTTKEREIEIRQVHKYKKL